MTEEVTNNEQAKSKKKIFIAAGAVMLLAIVIFFVFFSSSPKEKYFLAERNYYQQLQDEFEARYAEELAWYEHSQNNAIESTLQLALNLPESYGYGIDGSFTELLNSMEITITGALDREEEKILGEVSGELAGVEVDGLNVYIEGNQLYYNMPFTDDTLMIDGNKYGELMSNLNPYYEGEDELDFSFLFDTDNYLLMSEEDLDYIQAEYIDYLYQAIPEEAFDVSDETITLGDQEVKTEKIDMHLSDEVVQGILSDLLDKLEDDQRLEDIMIDMMVDQQSMSVTPFSYYSMGSMEDIYRDAYQEMITTLRYELEEVYIPGQLRSTIWVHSDIIVNREFVFDIYNTDHDVTESLEINGTHDVTGEEQRIDYLMTVTDHWGDQGTLGIEANLMLDENGFKDEIILSLDDQGQLIIELDEQNEDDGTKSFDRRFAIESAGMSIGSLTWHGQSNFDNDIMSAEHHISLAEEMYGYTELFGLTVNQEEKTIGGIEQPPMNELKVLTDMDADQLYDYVESELSLQAENWLQQFMFESLY
ncbi:DUF6583 family protein [Amphibacillus jilinensis]|uniref:DUF6583 family protein n=1 Tax=Amphibacillus jilinensis TaxID=1216008 RepID=UPI0003169822|nr:DUF6583 family protein [Amphibacillus jilinensis]